MKKKSPFDCQPDAQTQFKADAESQHEYVTIAVPQTIEHSFAVPLSENIEENINLMSSFPSGDIDGELKENILTILKNQENLAMIIQNQEKILQRISKIEVMFDEFVKVFTKKQDCIVSEKNDNNIRLEPFQPIDNIENLQNLEDQLKNKNIFNEYIEKLTFICGKSNRIHRAIDNCYLLVDRFFTRQFMTICSWAGGSKNDVEKIPFKIYKNIINLFFQVIYLSDNNFTMLECELFFKNVIKNSTRRNDNSRPTSRQSKTKNRPKKLEYNMKEARGLGNLETQGEREHELHEARDDEMQIAIEEENLCEVLEVQMEDENLPNNE